MRVHLQNVIGSALERGVMMGYQRTNPSVKMAESSHAEFFMTTMMESIWESLDSMVDFSEDESTGGSRQIGFQSTDAIGHVPSTWNSCNEEEDDIIPLG